MSSPLTSPHADAESSASIRLWLGEKDLLFNAYFDADLTDAERQAFEHRLGADPEFKRDYDVFLSIMGGLRGLPPQFAPDDFIDRVQSRMRHRSAGKFFAQRQEFAAGRMPYEVIAVVMMLVMAMAYLMMESPRDANLQDAEVTVDAGR